MLIDKILQRENMLEAHRRVLQNKGAPGIDGMTVDKLWSHCKEHWSRIRKEILNGSYRPQPVKKVEIPKPGGGGKRLLGIPTVVDRLIQQAICQILTPIFEPMFSESSFGYRPGRSAHDAVLQAQKHIAEGRRWVVDIDLERFFDRVNHDILMARVARQVDDKHTLLLIRRFLQAGIMEGGVVSARTEGTPQGSPLSPLLSNIMLDDVDKELERRGHHFARYADDMNTYVRSEKAGLRVMESIADFIETKLRLKVNRSKSAVARPWKRKFLGYTVTTQRNPRLKIAPESVKRFKAKLRPVFRKAKGKAIFSSAKELNPKLRGWMNYYRLAQVKVTLEELDAWIRRKFRVAIWRQWKTPRTRFHKLIGKGVNRKKAARASWGKNGPWASAAGSAINYAIPNSALKSSGLISLVDLHRHLAHSS